jgi:hypothetical protein
MPRIHLDRASVITTAIMQLAGLPEKFHDPIETAIRDEIADAIQQAVADRADPQPGGE